MTLLPAHGNFFLLLGYLVLSSYEVIHLVLLHVSMLSLVDVTKMPAFSEGKWRSSRWGKRRGYTKRQGGKEGCS